MKKEKTVNLNGTYYSAGKLISADNRAFLYGDSIFESLRCHAGEILWWNYHYARLLKAAATMGFTFSPWWTEDYFRYEVKKTLHQNKLTNARVRLILFREEENSNYRPESDRCSYLIQAEELDAPLYPSYETGLNAGVYEDARKSSSPFSFFKSGQSLLYVMAARKARNQGWDEVLILNQDGRVCESGTANIFVVKNKEIVTPPLSENGIDGVMRTHLMRLLPSQGMEVVEAPVTTDDLELAEEIWVCNAVRGVRWVYTLGNRHYQSELATQVQGLLSEQHTNDQKNTTSL